MLQGYNATILAYGPTGTGKTFSMEGRRGGSKGDLRGIIPRSMEDASCASGRLGRLGR